MTLTPIDNINSATIPDDSNSSTYVPINKRYRNSFSLVVGAIKTVSQIAEEQYMHVSDVEDPLNSTAEQSSRSLYRKMSLLKIGNDRILEGLDNIIAIVSDDMESHSIERGTSSITTVFTNPSNSTTNPSVEELLRGKEEEMARAFEERLQLAIKQTQEQAKMEIARAEAEFDVQIGLVRQESQEREEKIRFSALQESNQRVANLTKMLVQNISHEIRSPLNVISTGLHIVEDRLVMSQVNGAVDLKDLIDIIKEIKNSCKECSSVLDDIVVYEAIKRGELKLFVEHVKVYNAVKTCIKDFILQAKLCKISLVYEDASSPFGDDEGPTVVADVEKLKHVIYRFISSALRFTPADNEVKVRVRWVRRSVRESLNPCASHGFVRIEFVDAGGGIPTVLIPYCVI